MNSISTVEGKKERKRKGKKEKQRRKGRTSSQYPVITYNRKKNLEKNIIFAVHLKLCQSIILQ